MEGLSVRSKVVSFFEKYLTEMELSGGSGQHVDYEKFQIMPRDFIDFAEKDLEASEFGHSRVNATSNLKRAVDCQVDLLFVAMNLDDLYRRKRLGVDRKLGFLEKAGLFRSRSLEKLNRLRNRLEHHYEYPDIEDVEVYFDLVVAFVSVLESQVSLVGYGSEANFSIASGGEVTVTYDRAAPSIQIELKHDDSTHDEVLECSLGFGSDLEKIVEFAYFLKVHYALSYYANGVFSEKHVMKLLRD